jgi:hypothetical protein
MQDKGGAEDKKVKGDTGGDRATFTNKDGSTLDAQVGKKEEKNGEYEEYEAAEE